MEAPRSEPSEESPLVARILRGRELAGEVAGIPPLNSEQVLDLQRNAGNRLTGRALARWTEPLERTAGDPLSPPA